MEIEDTCERVICWRKLRGCGFADVVGLVGFESAACNFSSSTRLQESYVIGRIGMRHVSCIEVQMLTRVVEWMDGEDLVKVEMWSRSW